MHGSLWHCWLSCWVHKLKEINSAAEKTNYCNRLSPWTLLSVCHPLAAPPVCCSFSSLSICLVFFVMSELVMPPSVQFNSEIEKHARGKQVNKIVIYIICPLFHFTVCPSVLIICTQEQSTARHKAYALAFHMVK